MVIGFDGSRAFVKNRTGTENYSYQLLKHLVSVDREVHIKVYIRPGTKIEPDEWGSNVSFELIDFPYLWTQVGLAIQTFSDKLDLLFVPAHTIPLVRRPGLKTVMVVHDLGAEYLPGLHQLKQQLYLKFITDIQLKSVSYLIAVSNATKQDLINKVGITEDKISVVYEGVNREVFKPIKNDALNNILKSFNIENGKYFLFVGTVQPRKNLERLIEAFSAYILGSAGTQPHSMSSLSLRALNGAPRLPSPKTSQLVIAGGKGWMSENIYEVPKKFGVEGKVKFLGRVSNEELVGLYNSARAFVLPSLFEGFGLPILEAFACKCPVITSNISSMPEVAGDSAILIDPYDINSISASLEKLEDNNLRMKLIEKGLKQVEKFSWQITARETMKIIKKIVQNEK